MKTKDGLIFCHLCDSPYKELYAVVVCGQSIAICYSCFKTKHDAHVLEYILYTDFMAYLDHLHNYDDYPFIHDLD